MNGGLGMRLLLAELLLLLICIFTIVFAFEILGPLRYAEYEALYANQQPNQPFNAPGFTLWGPNAGQSDDNFAFISAGREALLIATGLTAILGAGISLIVARRVAQPLRDLASASHNLAAGNYQIRVQENGLAEIGELGRSFNILAQSLQATEQRRHALIADVAHELRTPLVGIEGYMEGLLDGVIAPSPETFERVRGDAIRLRKLVVDLEELSRVEEMQVRLNLCDLSLCDIVHAAIERVQSQFLDSTTTAEIVIPPNLPLVRADPDRLLQILLNLIGNAYRYTPDGGRITIRAGIQPPEQAGQSAKEACISIEDTGAGIPAEHLPHIFERFYRVDKARSRALGGSGVGLAIVKSLVEAQHGHVWVESAPGVGSTFSFTVPLAVQPTAG